jgi:hypothetical protein
MKTKKRKALGGDLSNARIIGEAAGGALLGRSVDDLLCDPDSAGELCDAVRNALDDESLTDNTILKSLLNARKRGWLTPAGTRKPRRR